MMVWTGGQSVNGEMAPILIAAFTLVLFPITKAFLPLSSAEQEWTGYAQSHGRLKKVEEGKRNRTLFSRFS